jgi:Spy/CpxP family protein refolding chaperone
MTRWVAGILLIVGLVAVPMTGMAQMKGMGGKDSQCGMSSGDGDGGMGGMGMGGMGMGGDMGDMMGLQRMTHAFSMLDLRPEQTTALKRLRLQHQKEAMPLRTKIQEADLDIEELKMADKPDIKKIEAKLKEKHDALAKMEASHIDLQQKMKAVLTPEQRKDLETMMERGPMMGMGSKDGTKGKKGKGKHEMGGQPMDD